MPSDDIETYYQVLEIAETASFAEIKSAYRMLAHQYHPDKVPEHLEKLQRDARNRFEAIKKAYECLSDPDRRRQYDAILADHRATSQQPDEAAYYASGAAESAAAQQAPSPPPPVAANGAAGALAAREADGKRKAIIALCLIFIPCPCITALIALVFAHIAYNKLQGTGAKGHRNLALGIIIFIYGAVILALILTAVDIRQEAAKSERRSFLQSKYPTLVLGVWKDQDGDMYEYKADGTKLERLRDGRESRESWAINNGVLNCGSWQAQILTLTDSRYEIRLPDGRMWTATRVPQSEIDAERAKVQRTRALLVGTWRNEDGTRTFADDGRVIGKDGPSGSWSIKNDTFTYNGDTWKIVEIGDSAIYMKFTGVWGSDFRATRVK